MESDEMRLGRGMLPAAMRMSGHDGPAAVAAAGPIGRAIDAFMDPALARGADAAAGRAAADGRRCATLAAAEAAGRLIGDPRRAKALWEMAKGEQSMLPAIAGAMAVTGSGDAGPRLSEAAWRSCRLAGAEAGWLALQLLAVTDGIGIAADRWLTPFDDEAGRAAALSQALRDIGAADPLLVYGAGDPRCLQKGFLARGAGHAALALFPRPSDFSRAARAARAFPASRAAIAFSSGAWPALKALWAQASHRGDGGHDAAMDAMWAYADALTADAVMRGCDGSVLAASLGSAGIDGASARIAASSCRSFLMGSMPPAKAAPAMSSLLREGAAEDLGAAYAAEHAASVLSRIWQSGDGMFEKEGE